MNIKALLIAWPDLEHVWHLKRFERYLKRIGVQTQFMLANQPERVIIRTIRTAAQAVAPDEAFLVVFNGHGNPKGWASLLSKEPRNVSIMRNRFVAPILASAKGTLIIVSQCCYGSLLLADVKKYRKRKNTHFISAWDGDEVIWNGPLQDLTRFWPMGKMPEEMIAQNIYCPAKGRERIVPLMNRWGQRFDHLFFPTTVTAE